MDIQTDFSRRSAAERLCISAQTLDRLIRVGEIESYRVRRRVLIPAEALDRYVARCRMAKLVDGTAKDTKEKE